ncbi:MAG TPA: protease complex subunit PrcB family protein [Pyrinomonadaceae bacterium]|nr:protease complex subunit PrcB family protein [Pyrinomonadaceae bacterium]
MKITRKTFGVVLALSALVLNAAAVSACAVQTREGASGDAQNTSSKTQAGRPATQPSPVSQERGNLETKVSGEIKELASGGYSSVREPFILVARDAQTYAGLRKLHDKLPEQGADFFKTNAVVAAFLGQRSSGGYGVQITHGGAAGASVRLRVSEKSPAKDAFSTMALTQAFQIISVPVQEESPLALELGATWQQAARPYKVSAGEFTRMGGFAGRRERSTITGDVRVMRHGLLATVFFVLEGAGAEGKYALQDVASGTVTPQGTLTLARLDPGSFVPPPRHPLGARGQFANDEGQLSLAFEVMETKVNDGYSGQGKLEATATAPPPKKRAVAGDDPM